MMDARAKYRHLGRFSSKYTSSSSSSQQGGGDRFIPNRSAMDLDIAHYLLTATPRKEKKKNSRISTQGKEKGAYREILDRVLLQNRTRILVFNSKPPTPTEEMFPSTFNHKRPPLKKRRYVPQSPESVLEAPNILDDFYLNLLDWGKRNILAIALGNSVYSWNASVRSASELVRFNGDVGPVSSVSWSLDGHHIAFGLSNSLVQLWDVTSNRPLRTLQGIHQSRVGSLAWNGDILTTGGMDGNIVNNDVRIRSHIVQNYRGHHMEVCGLKWSGSGKKLASGGNDDLVHVWDCSMASSTAASNQQSQWLHRFEEHTGAVRALAWCPFRRNLLASGGGESDRCIRFWNTDTGVCLNSVDTSSQVCGLIWSKTERELLSSHGLPHNNLALWKYPSMEKIAKIDGHSSRVLFTAQSPDGCTVASAAGDHTLKFWKVYEASTTEKVAEGPTAAPFASFSRFTTIR